MRQAAALPLPTERLYFALLLNGRRFSAELALVACDGLASLLVPRLGPERSLVERQKFSPRERLVKFAVMAPDHFGPDRTFVQESLAAGLGAIPGLSTLTVLAGRSPPAGAETPASLCAALAHLTSISPLLARHQLSKSSEAWAGRAEAARKTISSATVDTFK